METKYQFVNRDSNNFLKNAFIALYLNKGISVNNLGKSSDLIENFTHSLMLVNIICHSFASLSCYLTNSLHPNLKVASCL